MKKSVILFLFAAMSAQAELIEKTVTFNFPAKSPGSSDVRWKGLDLLTGLTSDEPQFGAQGWQLRARLAYASTNQGAAVLLENQIFEAVTEAPNDGYAADVTKDPDTVFGPTPSDIYNEKINAWGLYNMADHSYMPEPNVIVLRTSENMYAKIQLVDYVKNGKTICFKKGRDGGVSKVKEPRDVAKYGQDGLIHLTVRYVLNTTADDRKLGEAVENPQPRRQLNASCDE